MQRHIAIQRGTPAKLGLFAARLAGVEATKVSVEPFEVATWKFSMDGESVQFPIDLRRNLGLLLPIGLSEGQCRIYEIVRNHGVVQF